MLIIILRGSEQTLNQNTERQDLEHLIMSAIRRIESEGRLDNKSRFLTKDVMKIVNVGRTKPYGHSHVGGIINEMGFRPCTMGRKSLKGHYFDQKLASGSDVLRTISVRMDIASARLLDSVIDSHTFVREAIQSALDRSKRGLT